jgi:rod shape-determining protein MreB
MNNMHVSAFGAADTAIDLGTTNAIVYVRGRGIVLSEPSVVAVDADSGRVRAVGSRARQALETDAGELLAVRPLQGGVIADLGYAEELLRRLIRAAHHGRRAHPRLVAAVPSGATKLERRALEEACLAAGARAVHLIEAPLAAAIGAGLPVEERGGVLVADVGGGITEAAVIALGGIVVSCSARLGSEQLGEAIVKHVRRAHGLAISAETAEEAKRALAAAIPLWDELHAEVSGVEAASGASRTVALTGAEVRAALERPLGRILAPIKEALAQAPPEMSGELLDRGITLVGGGSLLLGLEQRLREETTMRAQLARLPITCVAAGAGAWLEGLRAVEGAGAKRLRPAPARSLARAA